ncbi:M50 family metallopeptidase [Paraliomyxa miuraensis]|uniref:M50 family metallopeptidase n=1 Tax=Paraliomyxa miuraensis TaxID=376150 RepID=UPI00225B4D53|nr:M50 family metallopeptidase [Paraliomyxa miuraensis]MCX4241701.1 M50 family metallopeptidase [Paraliomyxa miuraensis]
MSIVIAIVALCVVIILHETGHYLAAVWTGMKVDRFSVFGIGPTVVKLGTWRGTEFVISAIPFGAFVLIRGMELSDEERTFTGDPIDEDAWKKAKAASPNFRDKPLWARAAVLLGGPVANYIGAMLLFFGLYAAVGVPGPPDRIEVGQVAEGGPAARAGLQTGDRIVAVGDVTIDPTVNGRDLTEALEAHRNEPVSITVLRDEQTLVQTVTPDGDGKIQIGLGLLGPRIPVSLGTAASLGVSRPIEYSKLQLVGLYKLATFQTSGKVEGPVGIVKQIKRSVERGLIDFAEMTAIISTLLGLFNLLPLPALDGGRLSFLLFEGIARRRAKAHVEEMVHGYGMLALLVLLAVVTVRDIFPGLF